LITTLKQEKNVFEGKRGKKPKRGPRETIKGNQWEFFSPSGHCWTIMRVQGKRKGGKADETICSR